MIAAEWLFPVSSPPLFRHAIEVEGGIIREIRPIRDSDPFLSGVCLLPGLINAHTHLAYTAMRNLFDDLEFFPWIRKLTETKYQRLNEKDMVVSTQLGILECLKAGITTVADMSDLEPALRTLSESPLRGIFYWEVFGVEKSQAEKSWQELQETYPRLMEMYGNGRLQVGISPHSCYTVRPELYRLIADWAIKENIPISFHLAESREEEDFIGRQSGPIMKFLERRAADWEFLGSSSVSHLEKTGIFDTKPLLAHLVQIHSEDMEILSSKEISVGHCPKSNAKFGHGIAPVCEFLEKGLRVGIGSDSVASNNRFDLFEEARFALLQQRLRKGKSALSEEQMLKMMTIEGAKTLRIEDCVGSLEVGKAADIIAVRIPPYYTESSQVLRHLIHNSCSADVARTYISGKEISVPDLTEGIEEIYRKVSL